MNNQGRLFDREQLVKFASEIIDPSAGCTELRIKDAHYQLSSNKIVKSPYRTVVGGWFNNVNSFVQWCSKLEGVSAYITINPVNNDLLARCCNRADRITNATKDDHINIIRWIFLDIDVERPEGISSTQSELDSTILVRDRILEAESLHDKAIWGISGNGSWILVRIPDSPNNEETHTSITDLLEIYSDIYGKKKRDSVFIDPSVGNAARIMCVPGTQKCKGDNIPDRPWRLCTIDGGYCF